MIDLLSPLELERGGDDHNVVGRSGGVSLFCGIGDCSREAEELARDIRSAGVLDRIVMVFGQMNEPPGCGAAWGTRRSPSLSTSATTRAVTCCSCAR